ncbi:MAG: OsmC family protein [Nodosilinea sp.]
MTSVQVSSNASRYGQAIAIRQFELSADEPASVGGDDQGPTPTELLLAGLCSCKAITIRMYAERKGWPVDRVYVAAELHAVEKQSVITAYLTLVGDLTDEQRDRLGEIGDRCPVHRLLIGNTEIHTVLTHSTAPLSE